MPTPQSIKKFYQSKAWKQVRATVVLRSRGICSRCGMPGDEVHHIKPLTERNVKDPVIALGLSNLELLCTSCHNAERSNAGTGLRPGLHFDALGNLVED